MTVADLDGEQRRRAERARRIALFRYELIQEVIDPALSSRQRGRLVRQLVQREHTGPFGERVRVSRPTIDRWCRWWRAGGFEALVPTPARVEPRTPAEVLAMAAGLKRENPDRTAAQVVRILRGAVRVGALGTHPATPLQAPRTRPGPAGQAAGVRPVRSRPVQRVVGRRCAA